MSVRHTTAFAVGCIMLTASLSDMIWVHKHLWVLSLGGIVLTLYPATVTWIYGPFRPNPKEVRDMSAKEYDEHLPDPKFQRYINHTHKFPWLRKLL